MCFETLRTTCLHAPLPFSGRIDASLPILSARLHCLARSNCTGANALTQMKRWLTGAESGDSVRESPGQFLV